MKEAPQRYAPPSAEVADVGAADALLAARPRSVVWACALMLASMLIGLVSLLPVVDPPMPGEPAAMTALIWGITLVFTTAELWLLGCVWRRRNWARWVIVSLALLGIVVSLPIIGEDWARSPLLAGLGIAGVAISAAAAALLLAGASARWFKGTVSVR